MELDALDKKVLSALNRDVRMSLTQIAKEARTSKEVVHYRIHRLLERGILKEFITVFNLNYWAHKVIVQFQNISAEEEEGVITYLVAHPNTDFVSPCSGNWDLVFAIMAKDPAHFEQVLREITTRIGKYIHDYRVGTSVGGYTFGHNYLLRQVHEVKPPVPKQHHAIDEKDIGIMRVLRTDARAKLTEISAKTGIPADTVKYRIKQLREQRIIKRYRLILDSRKLGYTRYEMFIRCTHLSDALVNRFVEYAKQHPNVEYLGRCVGSFDFTLTVHLKQSSELREFVLEIKKEFGKEIQNFESVTLFSTLKYTYEPEELREASKIGARRKGQW
jgi:DNA-binding Lrp family transcriptional regulator